MSDFIDKVQCIQCGWVGTFDELENCMGRHMACPVCGGDDQDHIWSLFQEYKWSIRWLYRFKARILERIKFWYSKYSYKLKERISHARNK